MTRWKNQYGELGKELKNHKLKSEELRTTLAGLNTTSVDSAKKMAILGESVKEAHTVWQTAAAKASLLKQGLAEISNETQKGSGMFAQFGAAFKGAFVGAVAGFAFSAVVGGIQSIAGAVKDLFVSTIQLGAKFESVRNTMAVFTGSMAAGRAELDNIAEVTRTTTGLRLEDAEIGTANMRALGFSAKTALDLVVGLAKTKTLSPGIDAASVERVVRNLTQLASGSPRIQKDIQEMITAMPILRQNLILTFGSIDQFKAAIKSDANGAIEKFAEGLKNTQAAAGGLEDAWGKTADEFIKAGRKFSEPFLPVLTDALKDLSGLLNDNSNVFVMWGTTISDTLQGVINAFQDLGEWEFVKELGGLSGIGKIVASMNPLTATAVVANNTFAPSGAATRAKKLSASQQSAKDKFDALDPSIKKPLIIGEFYNADGVYDYKKAMDALGEAFARQRNAHIQDIAKEENARQKLLVTIETQAEIETATVKAKYDQQKAELDSYLTYTTQEQSDAFNKQAENELKYLRDTMRINVSRETAKINAYKDGTPERAEAIKKAQIAEIEGQSAIAVKVKEIQKKQKEFELEILEERRQALIEFYSITTREITSALDTQSYRINRELKHQTSDFEQQYQELIDANFKAFQEIYNNTVASYQAQLQNRKLTAEKRQNLEKQMNSELTTQLEQYNRKVQELEDARYEMQISRLEAFARRQQEVFESQIGVYQGLTSLLTPDESFSSANQKAFESGYLGQARAEYTQNLYDKIQNTPPPVLEEEKLALQQLREEFKLASTDADKFFNRLLDRDNKVSNHIFDIAELGSKLTTVAGSYKLFDEIASKSLIEQQKIQKESLDTQLSNALAIFNSLRNQREADLRWRLANTDKIEGYTTENQNQDVDTLNNLLGNITDKNGIKIGSMKPIYDTKELLDAASNIERLRNAITSLSGTQGEERLKQYKNTLDGLDDTIAKLVSHDIGTGNALTYLFESSNKKETISNLVDIAKLQYDIEHAAVGSQARIAKAYWESAKASAFAWEEAQKTISANAVKIADSQVFHQERVQAKLSDWIASQKSIDDVLADAMIGTWDAVFNSMENGIGKLTSKFGIFGDVIKNILVSLAKMALMPMLGALFGLPNASSVGVGGSQSGGVGGGILGWLGGLFKGKATGSSASMGGQGATATSGGFASILSGLGLGRGQASGSASNPLAMALGNGLSNMGANVGVTGGGFGFKDWGGAVANGIGFGGMTTGLTTAVGGVGSSLYPFATNTSAGSWGGLIGPGVASAANGGNYFSNLLGGIGSALPSLGMGLGASLGKNAGIGGQLLGSFGGLLGGIAGMGALSALGFGGASLFGAATGTTLASTAVGATGGVGGLFGAGGALSGVGGIFSSAGGLLGAQGAAATALGATVILAPIAALLMLGTWLWGRSKLRRKEEKIRTEVLLDAKSQLKQLIDDVNHDRIDGSQALEQAKAIRQNYLDRVGQLRDKKTRNIAISAVRDLDSLINNDLTLAVGAQKKRQTTNQQIIPEFATGGIIPGVDKGYDSMLIKARPGEVVLTKQHQMMLGGARTMGAIGVPGFAFGGTVGGSQHQIGGDTYNYTGNSGSNGDITIVLVADQKFAEDMTVKGEKKIINIVSDNIGDRGKIYHTAAKTL